ncbi:fimbrial protein, partial [Vibrio sp. V32_P6A28T40]
MKKLNMASVTSFFSLSSALMLAASPVHAENNIHFSGEITNQTCSVVVNGNANGNPIINLDPVNASSLREAGSTAGRKEFTLGVNGCIAPDDILILLVNLQPHSLSGPNNEIGFQTTIGNMGSAKNVDLQILDFVHEKPIYYSNGNNVGLYQGSIIVLAGETSGSSRYSVEYISHQGDAAPGT